jgi:cysteinyl-tRNA synthetase
MLELYNTMSRKREIFKPRRDGEVKMFTCGPSIYRRPHLGNYRSFLWEDVLQRYLEHLGYKVERVINLTDIEDKALSEARSEGKSVDRLTQSIADQFFKDAGLLEIKLPEFIPRSSTSVDQAVELIKILLEKGIAYRHGEDIFYDPLKFEGFGKLFRLDMSKWPKEKRRFKKDTYPGRRWNLGDFILWHGQNTGNQVYWDTDLGRGRPAWNIQDPAMITKHLGYEIDISCGGIDNIYRHHDYNISVIEGITGREFSNYWIHGEHLLSNGKKMSKSLGNIVYPEDVIEQGFSARHIRFFLIYGHHRKRMNLTDKNIRQSKERLDELRSLVDGLLKDEAPGDRAAGGDERVEQLIDRLVPEFEKRMEEDLNVKDAVDAIFRVLSELESINRRSRLGSSHRERIRQNLNRIDEVLRVIFR